MRLWWDLLAAAHFCTLGRISTRQNDCHYTGDTLLLARAAYSAVRVLKGQQQIEIISFSPAWGFQTELHATAGERGSKLCLNAQISAVTLFWVLHTDGRSKHMTATITLLHTANMQTHYWLALLSNWMKVSEPPACWAMIWVANISRICQHFSLCLDAHVGNATSSLACNISCLSHCCLSSL